MPNHETDPVRQLELLTAHQEEFEIFLKDITGLTVKVSLGIHSTSNSVADLRNLFEASFALDSFEVRSTLKRTWISHTDLRRNVSVFMPDNFDSGELYPEPEDDEGYKQTVEVANARHNEGQLKRNDDEIPF